jgi:hypothetical protein
VPVAETMVAQRTWGRQCQKQLHHHFQRRKRNPKSHWMVLRLQMESLKQAVCRQSLYC